MVSADIAGLGVGVGGGCDVASLFLAVASWTVVVEIHPTGPAEFCELAPVVYLFGGFGALVIGTVFSFEGIDCVHHPILHIFLSLVRGDSGVGSCWTANGGVGDWNHARDDILGGQCMESSFHFIDVFMVLLYSRFPIVLIFTVIFRVCIMGGPLPFVGIIVDIEETETLVVVFFERGVSDLGIRSVVFVFYDNIPFGFQAENIF